MKYTVFQYFLGITLLGQTSVAAECFNCNLNLIEGLDYDCRAYGCAHGGTCNPADGFCEDCDNEDLRNRFIQGNNCVFQDKFDTLCSGCNMEGTLKNNQGQLLCLDGDKCSCKEGFAGDKCSIERVEVTCSNDDRTMTIKIIPYNDVNGNTFEGKVTAVNRIENLNTADQHVLDPGTVVPDVGVPYSVDFETFEDRTGPENLKAVLLDDFASVYISIQHSVDVTSAADQLFMVRCHKAQGTVQRNSGSLFTVDKGAQEGVTNTYTRSVDSGVTMLLEREDPDTPDAYTEIQSNLQVGDTLRLNISSYDHQISVKKCVALNYDKEENVFGDEKKSLKLVETWCIPNEGRSVIISPPQSTLSDFNSRHEILIKFRAFYFQTNGYGDTSALSILCNVCIGDCSADDPGCNPSDHATEFGGYDEQIAGYTPSNRRRRDNSRLRRETMEANLDILVDVTNPSARPVRSGSQLDDQSKPVSSNQKSCFSRIDVLLPLVICAVLLVLSLATTACHWRRNNQLKRENWKQGQGHRHDDGRMKY